MVRIVDQIDAGLMMKVHVWHNKVSPPRLNGTKRRTKKVMLLIIMFPLIFKFKSLFYEMKEFEIVSAFFIQILTLKSFI